jgi:hypothetical protein
MTATVGGMAGFRFPGFGPIKAAIPPRTQAISR